MRDRFLKDGGYASQPAPLSFVVAAGHPFPLPWGLTGVQTPSPLNTPHPTGCSSSVSLTGPLDCPLQGVSVGRPGVVRLLPSLRIHSLCGELLHLPGFQSRLTPRSLVRWPELYRSRSPASVCSPAAGKGHPDHLGRLAATCSPLAGPEPRRPLPSFLSPALPARGQPGSPSACIPGSHCAHRPPPRRSPFTHPSRALTDESSQIPQQTG